jgi:M6 family metalloprotease-like protein
MTRRWFHRLAPLAVLLAAGLVLRAADSPAPPQPDLSEFHTVENAVVTRISRAAPEASQPAYLGVNLDADKNGRAVVSQVEPNSPAAKAGLTTGDVLTELDGKPVAGPASVRELLAGKAPGDAFKIVVSRQDKKVETKVETVEAKVTLAAVSRPMTPGKRAIMGIRMAPGEPDGAHVDQVTPGFPAASVGLKPGDVILKLDDRNISSSDRMSEALSSHKPGDLVVVMVKRHQSEIGFLVKLVADASEAPAFRWDDRQPSTFQKEAYHLAVVPIEYPDVKHNDKVAVKDWETALFSKETYNDKSATGQKVYGSLNDFYIEQSCGAFHVEGKVFDWVPVEKKRAEYGADSNRFTLLNEALDKLEARDGKDALKDYDGVFFLYAGERVQTIRGGLYWPHKASFRHGGKNCNYFICPEGGGKMASISVVAHEFGHMLGLPDLYSQSPDQPGLGVWCTMSTGHGQDGKPLHFSAWCKEQMGWLKPAVIDPTAKQKLILSPVENSTKECFKVLIKPDGSEYLLLENRTRKNFDRDLPGEGLLIWHVADGRPLLEESHGVTTPDGPTRFLGSVPYPSASNNAFTPFTTPSSKPVRTGGLPVHITNIQRQPDGRITFLIGYEFL